MNDDLDLLARWTVDSYAANRDAADETIKPLLVIVGGDFDALVTPADEPLNDTDVEELAFLIGYVGFACDPIYTVCTWESLAMERDVPRITIGDDPPDETTRTAVVTWAHCLPTRESILYMLARHIEDDGLTHWAGLATTDPEELALFDELPVAAHAFDRFPVTDMSAVGRSVAMQMLLERNGETHDTLFYEPGTLLTAAREHVAEY